MLIQTSPSLGFCKYIIFTDDNVKYFKFEKGMPMQKNKLEGAENELGKVVWDKIIQNHKCQTKEEAVEKSNIIGASGL